MKQRLSHSSVNTYNSCGRKYQLRYKKRYRSKVTSGALLFGSAMDQALNTLLPTRDLPEAIKVFGKSFHFGFINDKSTYLPDTTLVTYAESDFDDDLLETEDREKFGRKQMELELHTTQTLADTYAILMDKKGKSGFNSLTDPEKVLLNLANWLCLYRKGLIMLNSYNTEVMPKIKTVLAVQKTMEIENTEGDKLIGYIDLIIEMHDGTRWVMDNKTSTKDYAKDSPRYSQQLILYYHGTKDEYKLNGAGFIVMYKLIIKNKKKVCSLCQFDGSGGRHKTCPNEITPKKRCDGEWFVTIDPRARIEIITSDIPQAAEDLVLDTFDKANEGIKNENFGPNLSACNAGFKCDYFDYCWSGDKTNIEEVDGQKRNN